MTAPRTLVVIPTYNEAENIEPVLERVRAAAPEADVLIVDDGSPDGTGDLADKVSAADPQVNVLHRGQKAGLGAAYLAGFGWGLARDYDLLVEMDADGSHQPAQLPDLLAAAESADLVLGTRWMPGGQVVNWPWHRAVLSRGGNLYARLALGLPLHDATGGFRVFRRETLERIDLDSVRSQGYCFQVDLARRVVAHGFRVCEVPITFVERQYGESKMTADIVREALLRVTRWGLEYRGRQLAELIRGAAPMRRLLLVALFVGVPLLEIYVIIQVGQAIGAVPTILLLVLESALGAWLVKREGLRAWRTLVNAIKVGQLPTRELADASIILVGGVLLLTPGFVTDLFGFFFVLPWTRPIARRLLGAFVSARVLGSVGPPYAPRRGGAHRIYTDDRDH